MDKFYFVALEIDSLRNYTFATFQAQLTTNANSFDFFSSKKKECATDCHQSFSILYKTKKKLLLQILEAWNLNLIDLNQGDTEKKVLNN